MTTVELPEEWADDPSRDADADAWLNQNLEPEPAATNGRAPVIQLAPAAVSQPGLHAVTFDEFVTTEETAAEPLLGDDDKKLLPAGSSLVLYGEGGSGKTTLAIDMAAHIAAGHDWLAFTISQPATVLLVENEGPRAEFRLKLARKRDTWPHNPFAGRLSVVDDPWGRIDLRRSDHVAELAALVNAHHVDVVIAGPIRRLGLEGGGTPAETVAFMQLLDDVRHQCGRPIAIVLVHHENKGGDISGAFEAEFDTVVHVKADGRDRTQLVFRKSRWSSRIHRSRFTLAWQPHTEGFAVLETDIDDRATDQQENPDAAAWIVDYVTRTHAETAAGVPRTTAEDAFIAAHEGRGRNLARRIIKRELDAWRTYSDLASRDSLNLWTGEHPPPLATTTGEARNGIYLIPSSHASSPLATTPTGDTGNHPSAPTIDAPARHSPPPIEGVAGGKQAARAEPHPDDDIPF